ncbi:MAG: trehalose-phosphatase [Gemmatimonadaceae bacterium]
MNHATPAELASRLTGTPLIVMLDIDGTLADIVEHALDARVPDSARASLRGLIAARARGVHVALVTGRSVQDARRMVGIESVPIYGNHGMERSLFAGDVDGRTASDDATRRLRASLADLSAIERDFPGTSLEDKEFSFSLHYRAMNMVLLPRLEARVYGVAERFGLRASPGKRVFNIVSTSSANKGDAAREIVRDAGGNAIEASIVFLGDDVTDEDAFRELSSLQNALTVRVGDVEPGTSSAAKLWVDDVAAVHTLLSMLVASRT